MVCEVSRVQEPGRHLFRDADLSILWINGCECPMVLGTEYDLLRQRRSVSTMREFREHPFLTPGSRALAIALDERDKYTHQHSSRVVDLAHRLGLACGLESTLLSVLDMGAFFHDVGKIGIPDHILLKPSRFTRDEMAVMRRHPEKGEGIVRELGLPAGESVASAVRHHHEHYDGGGYPDGLDGEAIPVTSRIISVADSFDAMTGDRPYHPGRTAFQALDIMFHEAGSKLDPYLVCKLSLLVDSPQ